MKVSIFGLGYVGSVTGACLANIGHEVVGVDPNINKVNMINQGRSPVIEKDIDQLIKAEVNKKSFHSTSDWEEAVIKTDIALICVGTPQQPNGSIDLTFIKRAVEHVGRALKSKNNYFLVVIRSTVFPGTVENIIIPILEKYSKKTIGNDFGVCMNPEFLREGSSVYDFFHPPKNVIGEYDIKSGNTLLELYQDITAPIIRTHIKNAEMVKYADNTFHALKVVFANEIGNICKALCIDSHKVMDIFCMDHKLNLSSYYLKPGFAFGGSCLPKDLKALTYESKILDVDTPVLSSILESNKKQILKVIRKLIEYKGSTLGFLGLSFKGGTDDLRESPIVEVIETMIGKGYAINIYDKYVSTAKLIGSNKEYIEKEIPHISTLMCSSVNDLITNSDVIVIGNYDDEFREALKKIKSGQVIIDLVRVIKDIEKINFDYYGICW